MYIALSFFRLFALVISLHFWDTFSNTSIIGISVVTGKRRDVSAIEKYGGSSPPPGKVSCVFNSHCH